ncbi:MAG: glycosyl hydrolase family 28-related protein, partial [Undibacterium sp.]
MSSLFIPPCSVTDSDLPAISAADYGTVGDGVANDTDALQAAVAAAKAAKKPLFFPAGTYLLTAPIVLDWHGARIIGAGSSHESVSPTILKCTTDITLISVSSNREGVSIEGLRLTGPGTGTSTKAGLHFVIGTGENCDLTKVERVHSSGFYYGIRADDVANSQFISCDCSQNTYGFYSAGNCNSNALIGVAAMSCAQSGIRLVNGSGWSVIGGDIGGQSTTTPLDIEAESAVVQGVNFECYETSSGTIARVGGSYSRVGFSGCTWKNLVGGGTMPYAVTVANGSKVHLEACSLAIGNATTGANVKLEIGLGAEVTATATYAIGIAFSGATPLEKFIAGPIYAASGGDGVSPSASTVGRLNW